MLCLLGEFLLYWIVFVLVLSLCFMLSGGGRCWVVYDDVLVRFVVLLFFL